MATFGFKCDDLHFAADLAAGAQTLWEEGKQFQQFSGVALLPTLVPALFFFWFRSADVV